MPSDNSDFLIAQFNALRNEIIQREQMSQQLINYAFIFFGGLLTADATLYDKTHLIVPFIALYPPIAMLLSFSWLSEETWTRFTANFIRTYIEENFKYDNKKHWEQFLDDIRSTNKNKKYKETMFNWSDKAIFIITEILAIIIGYIIIYTKTKNITDYIGIIFLGVEVIILYITIWFIHDKTENLDKNIKLFFESNTNNNSNTKQ